MKRARVIVLLALLASLRAMGADAVRIAILAGEGARAPKVGVVDRLMAELSKRPEVVILEREAIGKILAEQKLSLAGLTDHPHAVRLGMLLGADALLAVERLGQEQDKARQYRVKVIEAQTGLTAGDRFFDGPAVEKNPEIMAADVDRSLAWLRTPAGRRRYVAVLGYAAEQRGESLTDLPVALGALVESRIAQATNVLVVDREYLRRLQDEQELTGVVRQLALSSYLIEGLIRPSATNATRVNVQTRVHPLQGTAALPVLQSQGSVSNVSAMAHDVVGAILRQIDADPLPADTRPAAQEAARLSIHAQTLQRYGETARSLPLLESAYVLDPKPGTALLLAETIKAQAVQRAGTTNALAEAEKQELLTSFLRAMRLWQVEMDQRIADSRGKTVPFLPATAASAVHVLGPLWPRLRSEDPETRRLFRELREQKDACRQREVAYVRELWPRFRYGKNKIPGSTGYYSSYVWHEVGEVREMSEEASEYVAQMKQLMTPWLEMPGYTSPYLLGMLLQRPAGTIPGRLRSPGDVTEMLAWADWVSSRPSLYFQMAGLYYKVLIYGNKDNADKDRVHMARAQSAAAVRELIDLYPDFLARYGNDFFGDAMLSDALGSDYQRYRRSEEEWKALYPKKLDAIVTRLDRRSFAGWLNENWRREKYGMKRLGEDFERSWLEAAAARLPPPHLARYRSEIVQAAIDSACKEIETRRFELSHGGQAPTQALSPFWQAYRIEPVELGATRQPDEQLRLCKHVGDRLALVWMTPKGEGGLPTFRAEVCNLDGQPMRAFPSFTQNALTASNAPVELRDVTLDDDHVFVAMGAAGLLVFSRSDVRLFGVSEGLPQAALVAVAAVGNKLVLGFDPDYLGAFDPRSGRFEEIAYSRSLLKRNPLDGCRQRFSVRGLASDPERACVWITTRQPDGVWRLSVRDGGIAPAGSQSFETLRVDDGVLLGAWRGTLSRYDPVTARWAPVPLFGQTGNLDPLHVLLGPDIISAGMAGGGAIVSGGNSFVFRGQMGLFLHKRVVRDAFHLPLEAGGKPAHIDFLVKTSDRTAIAGTRTGAFWRLTQPERPTPEEETLVREERAMDAFIAAQTNRVAVRALAASSTAAAAYAVTNLCDGRDGTCWASTTNEAQGAWIEIELDRPARLSSLRLVNGWVPDEKQRTLYPINHRARQLDVETDAGERALLNVEDHNDPQVLRVAFRKPVRRLRCTVTEIHESEVIDFEDPPWLNLSEITFYESREDER